MISVTVFIPKIVMNDDRQPLVVRRNDNQVDFPLSLTLIQQLQLENEKLLVGDCRYRH